MGNTGNLTALFLQARLASSRLPGKALLTLGGKTVLELTMEALKKVETDIHVLLTDHDSYPVFREYAMDKGFEIYEGPGDDVLARYVLAARTYGVETIVRATGDNPVVSWELASRIMRLHLEHGADYSGFQGMPLGLGVEVVQARGLETAFSVSKDRYEREHVSPYVYRRPKEYIVYKPEIASPLRCREGRVTLDTLEDYRLLRVLFDELYEGYPLPVEKTVSWIKMTQKHFVHDTIPV